MATLSSPLNAARKKIQGDAVYPVPQPEPMPGVPPLTNVGKRPKATLPQAPGVTPMPQVNPPVTPIQQPPATQPSVTPQPVVPPVVTPPPVTPMPQVEPTPPPVTPPAPTVTPPPTDSGVSDFGPGNDLRYTQFAPQASSRLADTGGMVDTARNQLLTAPDRQTLALETLKLAEEQGQPAYEQRVREVGQNAAKFGRIGAGMTTNELGDLATVRSRDLDQLRRGTALDAAGQTMSDRTGVLQNLGALETDQFNKEAAQRNELRGERTYESGVADKATQDAINQRLLEESLTQGQFGRNLSRAQLGMTGAQISANNATQASDTTNEFLQQLARDEALRRAKGG